MKVSRHLRTTVKLNVQGHGHELHGVIPAIRIALERAAAQHAAAARCMFTANHLGMPDQWPHFLLSLPAACRLPAPVPVLVCSYIPSAKATCFGMALLSAGAWLLWFFLGS